MLFFYLYLTAEKNAMITIIDYGMGNLANVRKGFAAIGYDTHTTADPKEIAGAGGLILPGVGAFRDSIECLDEKGMSGPIRDYAASGKPFLGICLGMQLIFDVSYEGGEYKGLGLVPGEVVRFPKSDLKVPHMGWNSTRYTRESPLWKDVPEGSYVYFVHSYYVVPKEEKYIATTTEYGLDFTSSISYENVHAVQFHPEKSQKTGLQILRNFAALCE
jgi:imidazole glycerol-phosphate synthase subunit HisH